MQPRTLSAAFALVMMLGCAAHADPAPSAPAGTYTLDPRHTCVSFKIGHLGFSHFTGRFDTVEGIMNYDPATPDQIGLDVTIYPNDIDTNDKELDDDLRGQNWFDVIKFPRATFHATKIERTGDTTAKIIGDFTLHGVTHTLVLDTTLVGAGTMPLTGEQVMGFSAVGTFDRSDYDMDNLEPFVGSEVTLQIDTEFDKKDPPAKEE